MRPGRIGAFGPARAEVSGQSGPSGHWVCAALAAAAGAKQMKQIVASLSYYSTCTNLAADLLPCGGSGSLGPRVLPPRGFVNAVHFVDMHAWWPTNVGVLFRLHSVGGPLSTR